MAIEISKQLFGEKIFCSSSVKECLNESDCCVVMTDWDDYKNLNESEFFEMKNKLVFDTRRIFKKSNFKTVKLFSLGVNDESK